MIKTKSIYDKKEESDGKRILITRYCPRGIRKNNFDRLFNIVHIISNLVAHIKDRSIHETLRTINKIAANPDELAYWTTSVETTAKHMCNDMSDNVTFMYCPEEKAMRLFVKNTESRDCLVKSVEIHLPIVPEPLQGFFSVFKYNLKNMKFD